MIASLDALDSAIAAGTFRRITSVLVARHGELVHESYADGDAGTLRNTRSVTKTVASMLVGIAIDRDALPGVDVPMWSFFSDLEPFDHDGTVKRRITIEDVLTMRSALDCNDGDPASPGNEEVMYERPDWLRFALDIPTDAASMGEFRYCTAGVTALAGLLERVTHERLEDFADRELFGPLGITTARWFRSPTGLVQTGGGLELRSRDLLALGQLALRAGRASDGRQIVSADWMATSLRPHVAVGTDVAYGYLWWIRTLRVAGWSLVAPMMQGNGGSKVVVLLDLDAVVVITSTNYGTSGMHEQTDRILLDHVIPALLAAEPPTRPQGK